jgi:hypothetical protein
VLWALAASLVPAMQARDVAPACLLWLGLRLHCAACSPPCQSTQAASPPQDPSPRPACAPPPSLLPAPPLCPAPQKGNENARSAHIALNTINVALFAWQIPTGLDIVYKVFEFTSWP